MRGDSLDALVRVVEGSIPLAFLLLAVLLVAAVAGWWWSRQRNERNMYRAARDERDERDAQGDVDRRKRLEKPAEHARTGTS
jgi:hypothetical protein